MVPIEWTIRSTGGRWIENQTKPLQCSTARSSLLAAITTARSTTAAAWLADRRRRRRRPADEIYATATTACFACMHGPAAS
uniref:Uncharacterized protein n=1 Tax=Oryza sativa subsp. japonica TaxID=39947 RepID=Q6Z3Z6_ORYSJ|nr:hypothetical protein [Oryza sativa Japonica Group]BAC84048.1 hypothetical protein [Oryza sativa Japonica Group]